MHTYIAHSTTHLYKQGHGMVDRARAAVATIITMLPEEEVIMFIVHTPVCWCKRGMGIPVEGHIK